MKEYLFYYELHVEDRTFPVHVLVTAESEEDGWKEFEEGATSGKHFHLQAKGCLGEVAPELLRKFMAVDQVARPEKTLNDLQKRELRLDFEQWTCGLPPEDEGEIRSYMDTTGGNHIAPYDMCVAWLIKQIGGWEEMNMAEYRDR